MSCTATENTPLLRWLVVICCLNLAATVGIFWAAVQRNGTVQPIVRGGEGGSVGNITIDAAPTMPEPGINRASLSTSDLSTVHGVSADTVRRWLAEGRIAGAAKDASGQWVIPRDYVIQ